MDYSSVHPASWAICWRGDRFEALRDRLVGNLASSTVQYTHSNSNSNSNSNAYSYSHGYPDSDGYSHSYPHRDGHVHAYTNGNSYSYSYSNCDGNCNCNTNGNPRLPRPANAYEQHVLRRRGRSAGHRDCDQ